MKDREKGVPGSLGEGAILKKRLASDRMMKFFDEKRKRVYFLLSRKRPVVI